VSADRFKWLEFGDDEPPAASQKIPLPGREYDSGKDERWHLAEADRAYNDGQFESALRNYSAALRYKADLDEAWAGQVLSMIALGQIQQAVTWGQKGMEKVPASARMASALSYVYARAGSPEQGLAMSDQVMAAASEAPWFWIDRGVCLLGAGQVENGSTCMKKAAELSSADPDWLQRIGFEYLLADDASRALTAFNKALERRSDRVWLWVLTARAASRLHLVGRAEEALDQALALDPNHREAAAEKLKLRKPGGALSRPCWIASLVFEGEAHPTVAILRVWRDEVWLGSRSGRLAAWLYHFTAPLLCLLLARVPALQAPLRRLLGLLAATVARPPTSPGGREEASVVEVRAGTASSLAGPTRIRVGTKERL
jgi:tetratricopeptide (TPR) repeat protein